MDSRAVLASDSAFGAFESFDRGLLSTYVRTRMQVKPFLGLTIAKYQALDPELVASLCNQMKKLATMPESLVADIYKCSKDVASTYATAEKFCAAHKPGNTWHMRHLVLALMEWFPDRDDAYARV